MQPSERNVRIAAALIVAVGLAAAGLALLAEELGLGAEAGRGDFGWRRISLLFAGGVTATVGALLWARPRALSRLIDWEDLGPRERNVRIAAAVIVAVGIVAAGLALLAEELGLGAEAGRGDFGWRRISLLFAGGVTATVGALLWARPRALYAARARPPAFMRTPAFILVVAGVPAALVGIVGTLPCSPAATCSSGREVGGSLLTIVGAQLIMLALFAYRWASHQASSEDRPWAWTRERTGLREGLAIAVPALLVGLVASLLVTDRWLTGGIGGLSETRVIGVLALAIATQLVISSTLALGSGASIAAYRRSREAASSSAVRRAGSWLRTPAGIAAVLTVAFVAISWWWLATDTRPPTNDAARHLDFAFRNFSDLRVGEVTEALTAWNTWGEAPLMHIIGANAMLFSGGFGVLGPTLALNLIFVPLLALGTYGAASVAWRDPRAGVLAVMFVFAAPMLMSQFRVFMLDAPLAAMTALTTWLILASDRFARRDYTIAAGVAAGIGVMTKLVFPFYVVGLAAVVLLRGGWRNWRNLAWIAGPAALIAIPWMLLNWTELWPQVRDHFTATEGWTYGDYQFADRWSIRNFTYYAWSIVNHQLFLPLTAFLLVGIAVAAKDTVRGWRDRANYAPELLAGLVGGYFLTSLLPLDDSRYILPLLIYAAVLGTGWILHLGRWPRAVAITALAVVLVANTAVQNLAIGDGATIALEENPDPAGLARNGEGTLVVLNPSGFNALGRPDDRARTREIIDLAKARGIRRGSAIRGGGGLFSAVGAHLRAAQVPGVNSLERLGPNEMAIMIRDPGTPKPEGEPCTRWRNGSEYYVYRGDARRLAAEDYEPWCPLRP